MGNTEQNDSKPQIGTRLEQPVYDVVEQMRLAEDRTMSNMIAVLVKTHPRVKTRLEAETAGAAA